VQQLWRASKLAEGSMRDWPHSPLHRLAGPAAYIVTAGASYSFSPLATANCLLPTAYFGDKVTPAGGE
jgi:hypothetical protein